MSARALAIVAATLCAISAASAQTRDISANDYLDKMRGMFLGEIMGQLAGAAMEGHYQWGGLNYTVPWSSFTGTQTWQGDDDTVLEYMNINLLAANAAPTASDVAATWVNNIWVGNFYVANHQARLLMQQGLTPPATGGQSRNMEWWAIDSQITTESLGAAAPGMRQTAANLAGLFGSASNSGYALHAAQFYAAMYSDAVFDSDVQSVVAKGLAVVPTTSRTYQVIQDVRNWYAQDVASGRPDWRHTQELIEDKYFYGDNGRFHHWVESTINVGMTTLALLYGHGDFQTTAEIAAQAGMDTDCNAATASGLIGVMKGFSGLPTSLVGPAGDGYQANGLMNITTNTTLTAIAATYQTAAEKQIIAAGGSITGSGAGRVYHVPSADALQALVEKPDPTGPKGLVGEVLAAGGNVTVSASVGNHNPAKDRQNLDQIIDGITDVSYNGHLPYSTQDSNPMQPAGGDFYQINFDRTLLLSSVVYYEGDVGSTSVNDNPAITPLMGGYFINLTVEVGNDGVFSPVASLQFSEPLDPLRFYQIITMSFDTIEGDAIRIRGDAGGTEQYTTCLELEAYGPMPEPACMSLLAIGGALMLRRHRR